MFINLLKLNLNIYSNESIQFKKIDFSINYYVSILMCLDTILNVILLSLLKKNYM